MKILLLSDANSPHTLRWAKSLKNAGLTINLFSFYTPNSELYIDSPDIHIYSLNLFEDLNKNKKDSLSKLVYLRAVKKVKNIITKFRPDIIHSHYASSYGLIGALTGFHPIILSVWGADIYDFPNFSFLHRSIIKYNLSKADKILSTSFVMKEETKKYTNKEIIVTPFGIDVAKFFPQRENSFFQPDAIVIGTVKSLEKKYGIKYLIKAFNLVKKKFPYKSLKLLIVGRGSEELRLKKLCKDLEIDEDTIFTGYINHNDVHKYHNMLDISVFVSTEDSESFGVSVLESSSCAKPVVVSNVGGLPEVVEEGKTGFIVEPKNPEALADALNKLINNPGLRVEMGRNGRNKVLQHYKWNDSVKKMIDVYNSLLN